MLKSLFEWGRGIFKTVFGMLLEMWLLLWAHPCAKLLNFGEPLQIQNFCISVYAASLDTSSDIAVSPRIAAAPVAPKSARFGCILLTAPVCACAKSHLENVFHEWKNNPKNYEKLLLYRRTCCIAGHGLRMLYRRICGNLAFWAVSMMLYRRTWSKMAMSNDTACPTIGFRDWFSNDFLLKIYLREMEFRAADMLYRRTWTGALTKTLQRDSVRAQGGRLRRIKENKLKFRKHTHSGQRLRRTLENATTAVPLSIRYPMVSIPEDDDL